MPHKKNPDVFELIRSHCNSIKALPNEITMMTTNHFDRLDPALKRAARMDRVEHLDLPTGHELRRLYRHFYDRSFPTTVPLGPTRVSQAAASEAFKRHLDDPTAGAHALQELTTTTTAEATR